MGSSSDSSLSAVPSTLPTPSFTSTEVPVIERPTTSFLSSVSEEMEDEQRLLRELLEKERGLAVRAEEAKKERKAALTAKKEKIAAFEKQVKAVEAASRLFS